MSISDKVIKEIEEKNIKPVVRAKFVLINIIIWLFGIFAVTIGSLGVSALLHIVSDNDWDIYAYFGKTFFTYAFGAFPYVWVAILLIFVALAYFILRKTKTGYRYGVLKFFTIALVASAVFGTILFILGVGQYIDNALSENLGVYAALPHNKSVIWSNPKNGLVAGTITKLIDENEFILTDFANQEWIVIEEEAAWKLGVPRLVGEKVKLLGAYENDGVFITTEIRPWEAAAKPKMK